MHAPVRSALARLRALSPTIVGILLATGCAAPGGTNLLSDLPTGEWTDGAVVGDLTVVFTGGGRVTTGSTPETPLVLEPGVARSPEATLAALVVSESSFSSSCLRVSARVVTQQQLREGSDPNPWEVAWLVWDYSDNENFSYALVKANGWELGKRDPAYPGGQRFLATGPEPVSEPGQWGSWAVVREVQPDGSSHVTFEVDGSTVADVTDKERPLQQGRVGLYTEDATVAAGELAVEPCPGG